MRVARLLFPTIFALIILLGLLAALALLTHGAYAAPASPSAAIIYVDADATGSASGLDWTDAYTTVQDALAAATSGDEIWVAEGLYYPDEGSGQTNDDRDSTYRS